MSNQKRQAKLARRAKRQAKAAARQSARGPRVLAKCGGGPAYSREACLRAADAGDEFSGVYAYMADPSKVTVEAGRVVNRGPRPVTVAVTFEAPGSPGEPDRIETLYKVDIPPSAFIDFGARGVRPMFVTSPFADEGEIMERLRADGFCTPEAPASLGPWVATGVAGVTVSEDGRHAYNAAREAVKVLAVCSCEVESGHERAAAIKLTLAPRSLCVVSYAVDGSRALLLTTDAERAAEEAALRESFAADVAAGRMTPAEAADLMTMDDPDAERLIPDTVAVLAVAPPGTSRDVLRGMFDQAKAKARTSATAAG